MVEEDLLDWSAWTRPPPLGRETETAAAGLCQVSFSSWITSRAVGRPAPTQEPLEEPSCGSHAPGGEVRGVPRPSLRLLRAAQTAEPWGSWK